MKSFSTNYKKIITIVILNFFLILSIFICLEYAVYKFEFFRYKKYEKTNHLNTPIANRFRWFHPCDCDPTTIKHYRETRPEKRFRPDVGTQYNKGPILLFGCSYTYGAELKENETFSSRLSLYTKRPVYNRGVNSWGIQHMLFLLRQPEFFTTIPKPPEYVIYVFIPDHIKRLERIVYSSLSAGPYLRYELKDGELKEIKPSFDFLYSSYVLNRLYMHITYKYYLSAANKNEIFDLMEALFIESQTIVKKHYPNAKFVILNYQDTVNNTRPWMLDDKPFKVLEKQGFAVINTKTLIGRELGLPEDLAADNYHPSAKAWDLLTPALVKKLDL